ncbi:hypothetical protein C5S35_08210 [Candidatus Methanophagaceae archaeon]|nr:hypothetical protein C5S35_08210 [Methanophagales archaeon]
MKYNNIKYNFLPFLLVAIGRQDEVGKEKGMNIKGEYRDVLSRNVEIISDTCGKSTAMAAVCGIFLAAMMKKAFYGLVGREDMRMELTRTILLTFSIEEKEVVS